MTLEAVDSTSVVYCTAVTLETHGFDGNMTGASTRLERRILPLLFERKPCHFGWLKVEEDKLVLSLALNSRSFWSPQSILDFLST